MGIATGTLAGLGMSAAAGAYSAHEQKEGARDAANAQINAQNQAYQRNQANMQPYLNTGTDALNRLTQLEGGDFSGFKTSPDYLWTQQQGIQALDRSAAARGSLYSGGHDADLLNYSQGLASQQYGNYRNGLVQLASMGQGAAGALAGVNTGYATAVGNAGANAAYMSAGANSQLGAGLAGLASNYMQSGYGFPGSTSTTSNPNQLTSLLAGQASTGQGSNYNLGNNLYNFVGKP